MILEVVSNLYDSMIMPGFFMTFCMCAMTVLLWCPLESFNIYNCCLFLLAAYRGLSHVHCFMCLGINIQVIACMI